MWIWMPCERVDRAGCLSSLQRTLTVKVNLGLDSPPTTGRPWLLEANHCPCMRFKTRPNDKRLVVDMVKLALRMGLAESESLGLDELRWQPHVDMDGDHDASHAWRELRLDPPLPGGTGDESY